VELLVAIILLGIVLTMVSSFFIASLKIVTVTQATSQGTGNASNLMNELARVIRSGSDNPVYGSLPAPAFSVASPEVVTMVSYVDSYDGSSTMQVRPQMVQFSLDSNRRLVEKRWLPSVSSTGNFIFPALTTTPASQRTIGGPVVATPTGQAPLFSFLDANGNSLTPVVGTTQLSSIAAVIVTVRVKGSDAAQPAILLQNTVRIPNLGLTDFS
jgi:type II secretory pathway pseudopilin PulG